MTTVQIKVMLYRWRRYLTIRDMVQSEVTAYCSIILYTCLGFYVEHITGSSSAAILEVVLLQIGTLVVRDLLVKKLTLSINRQEQVICDALGIGVPPFAERITFDRIIELFDIPIEDVPLRLASDHKRYYFEEAVLTKRLQE